MKRGSYKIQDGYYGAGGVKDGRGGAEYQWAEGPARPPDSSYSSFLLCILFFLAICVVIMLAAWPWNANKPATHADDDNPMHDGLSGGKTTKAPPRESTFKKGITTPHTTIPVSLKSTSPVVNITEKEEEKTSTSLSTNEAKVDPRTDDETTKPAARHTEKDAEVMEGTTKSGTHEDLRGGVEPRTTESEGDGRSDHGGLSAGKTTTPKAVERTDPKNGTNKEDITSPPFTTPAPPNPISPLVNITKEEVTKDKNVTSSPPTTTPASPKTTSPLVKITKEEASKEDKASTKVTTAVPHTDDDTTKSTIEEHTDGSEGVVEGTESSTHKEEFEPRPPDIEDDGSLVHGMLSTRATTTITPTRNHTNPKNGTTKTAITSPPTITPASPKTTSLLVKITKEEVAKEDKASTKVTTAVPHMDDDTTKSTIEEHTDGSEGVVEGTESSTHKEEFKPRPPDIEDDGSLVHGMLSTRETTTSPTRNYTNPKNDTTKTAITSPPTTTPASPKTTSPLVKTTKEEVAKEDKASTKVTTAVPHTDDDTTKSTIEEHTDGSEGVVEGTESSTHKEEFKPRPPDIEDDGSSVHVVLSTRETTPTPTRHHTDPKDSTTKEILTGSPTTTPASPITTSPLVKITKEEVAMNETTTPPSTKEEKAVSHMDDDTGKSTVEGHTDAESTESMKDADSKPDPPVCWTPACKSDASRMLALMNHSADPCHNLYDFACGGLRAESGEWIAEEPEDLKPKQRILEMMQGIDSSKAGTKQKFKRFFDICSYYEDSVDMQMRQKKAADIIKTVGPFIFEDSEVENTTTLLRNLLLHNFPPIFDIRLDINPEESSTFILKLTPPELKSPLGHSSGDDVTLQRWNNAACLKTATAIPRVGREKDYINDRYDDYTKCNNNTFLYAKEVREALHGLELFQHKDKNNVTSFINEIVSFLQWELLEKIQSMLPNQTEQNIAMLERNYTTFTLIELQDNFTTVEWDTLISDLVGHVAKDEVQVNVYFETYFKSVFHVMNSLNERKLYNGLLAMFAHEVYYGLVVDRSSCSRREYCLAVASDLIPEAASALFLDSFHPSQLNAFQLQITEIYEQLKSQMKSELDALPWLKGKSKDQVLDKVSEMKVIADGGAALFLNETELDKEFEEYPLNSTYLEDAVSLMKRFRKKMYLSYKKDPMDQIWSLFALPYSVKGKTIYELNAVVIPYGVMLRPYMSEDSSKYLRMATLGNLIAREMWHHFDKTGLKYMPDGTTDALFRLSSMPKMKGVEKCMEEQYHGNKSIMDEGITIEFQLPVSLAINSRLADIGGSHLAFTTMQMKESGAHLPWLNMNNKQLYFLAIAQSMCTRASAYKFTVSMFEEEDLLPFLRVEDLARNSVEFDEAFFCDAKRHPKPACKPFSLIDKADARDYSTIDS